VNDALKDVFEHIHALSMKTWTPAQVLQSLHGLENDSTCVLAWQYEKKKGKAEA
jgi:hypothetical protein